MVKAKKKYSFNPDYAIPPGETLSEVLESMGMTQKECAIRTGLTEQSLVRIISGEQPITHETANRLEMVTKVPARFWNNLESQFREKLIELKEKEQLNKQLKWLEQIPYKTLITRKLIKKCEDMASQLKEVLKFFGVSSVDAWKELWENPQVAARRSKCFESCPGATSAWLRQGELIAQRITCAPFDKNKLKSMLPELRKLSLKDPEIFSEELVSLCASCGVAFALVPKMDKVPWNGATKWLNKEKVMIVLSLRGKYEDIFWFSLFHELGHVLNDGKKDIFINDGSKEDERELKANIFAANKLIPEKFNKKIINFSSNEEFIKLAKELEISPGIIVGRYQHLTRKWNKFKNLKKKFEWSNTN